MQHDLTPQLASLQSGSTTALADWRGPRATDFRYATTALALSVRDSRATISGGTDALQTYAGQLRRAREDIEELEREAKRRQASADDAVAGMQPNA